MHHVAQCQRLNAPAGLSNKVLTGAFGSCIHPVMKLKEDAMAYRGEERHPAAVIIFAFITCGIYGLVWIYKFSRDLKMYLEDENINAGLDLFLCIICFPYLIYWSYKYGRLLMEAQKKAGLPAEDNSVLHLVLALLGLFVVNMPIMQDALNKIWRSQAA